MVDWLVEDSLCNLGFALVFYFGLNFCGGLFYFDFDVFGVVLVLGGLFPFCGDVFLCVA